MIDNYYFDVELDDNVGKKCIIDKVNDFFPGR
jgi:hypothetical protein